MKKGIMTAGVLAINTCTVTVYCRAIGSETLSEYDFAGKTIIPFCTHGGSRFSDAIKTIRKQEPRASVSDGYAISRDHVDDSKESILKWLERIGMKK